MTEEPPPYFATRPSPAAPRKGRNRTGMIVVGVLAVLCLCGVCAVITSPAISAVYLPFKCQENTGLSLQECTLWTQELLNRSEYPACVNELVSQRSLNADSLYNCLVENGVGPD
jgi:hypothetical protein